ncbi:MAG: hypothetical protein ACC726_12030 [Chloroflexota bacterium]
MPGEGSLLLIIRTAPDGAILREDERHLDFRIWLDVAEGFLTVSTFVRFRACPGKLHPRPTPPVHDLIFRATLKQARHVVLDAASSERRAA